MTLRVIKTASRQLVPKVKSTEACLYIRRDLFPDGSYEEHAYIGHKDEVDRLAVLSLGIHDTEELDTLLRAGLDYESALSKLKKISV